jgi:hypothetical protein
MNREGKRYSHLYGWTEQNEAAYGVIKIEHDICPSEDQATIDHDGSLYGPSIPDGTWFLTFREAKSAAIKVWTYNRDLARRAISAIREQKEPQ